MPVRRPQPDYYATQFNAGDLVRPGPMTMKDARNTLWEHYGVRHPGEDASLHGAMIRMERFFRYRVVQRVGFYVQLVEVVNGQTGWCDGDDIEFATMRGRANSAEEYRDRLHRADMKRAGLVEYPDGSWRPPEKK